MTEPAITTEQTKPEKAFEVIVNGQQKTVPTKDVTFEEIVKIAFPAQAGDLNLTFVVTYRKAHAPHEGSLSEGGFVEIKKEGTIFNVTFTNKS